MEEKHLTHDLVSVISVNCREMSFFVARRANLTETTCYTNGCTVHKFQVWQHDVHLAVTLENLPCYFHTGYSYSLTPRVGA